MKLRDRFPSRADIFPVYSVIVFWAYSWGLLIFLFNLPSWLLMDTLWDILGYFSYEMVAVFLDTLLSLALLAGAAFLLPSPWLKNDFAVSGAALAGFLFFWTTVSQIAFSVIADLPVSQFLVLIVTALGSMAISVVVVRRLPLFRRLTLWWASSAGLFVYLYGFFTAFGLIVVLIRNVF